MRQPAPCPPQVIPRHGEFVPAKDIPGTTPCKLRKGATEENAVMCFLLPHTNNNECHFSNSFFQVNSCLELIMGQLPDKNFNFQW
jgi:hypothetical protein